MQLPPLEPDKARTRTRLKVRFRETDLMGIVHHAEYLTYFEVGRVDWLSRRGITYTKWTDAGIHLPVVEVNVAYKAPARFDDVLTLETRLVELRWASVRYAYTVLRGETLLAEGSTRLACVDAAHVLRRIPTEVLAVLAAGELDSPSDETSI